MSSKRDGDVRGGKKKEAAMVLGRAIAGGVGLMLMLMWLSPAAADTYESATFTGAINGGGANVKAPFSTDGFTQGETFSGSFVFDVQSVPVAGSGFVNVFFSSFPDIGAIPNATAFGFSIQSLATPDSLGFNLGDALVQFPTQEAAIQYNNGQFNGFFYVSDFTFQGSPFELQIQGSVFDVVPIVNGNPTFTHLINGHINVGDNSLTDVLAFTPGGATSVPEPAAFALLAAGIFGLGVMRRWRR